MIIIKTKLLFYIIELRRDTHKYNKARAEAEEEEEEVAVAAAVAIACPIIPSLCNWRRIIVVWLLIGDNKRSRAVVGAEEGAWSKKSVCGINSSVLE